MPLIQPHIDAIPLILHSTASPGSNSNQPVTKLVDAYFRSAYLRKMSEPLCRKHASHLQTMRVLCCTGKSGFRVVCACCVVCQTAHTTLLSPPTQMTPCCSHQSMSLLWQPTHPCEARGSHFPQTNINTPHLRMDHAHARCSQKSCLIPFRTQASAQREPV